MGGLSSIGHSHQALNHQGAGAGQSAVSLSFQHQLLTTTNGAGNPEVAVFGDYFATALDLILCYYALGDAERMRRGFLRMVAAFPSAAARDVRAR